MTKHNRSTLARQAKIRRLKAVKKGEKPKRKTLLTGEMPTSDDFLVLARKYHKSQDSLTLAVKHIQAQADLIRKTKSYPLSAVDKLILEFVKHPDWTITRLAKKCHIARQTAYKPACKEFREKRKSLFEMFRKEFMKKLPHGYRDKDTGWVEVHEK